MSHIPRISLLLLKNTSIITHWKLDLLMNLYFQYKAWKDKKFRGVTKIFHKRVKDFPILA
ncbi:MAG: hypothetical protein ACXACX_14605 [Candidatus Hodarchaeales archaeon]|jgi:hypothetical protein